MTGKPTNRSYILKPFDLDAERPNPIDAARGLTRGQRYRLPGWSDLAELAYVAKYMSPSHRKAGRPKGPYLITGRAEIEAAYRKLWARRRRRPTWTEVAREMYVGDRTLRRARHDFGLMRHTIAKEP